jgi:hypothetical protein
MVRVVASSCICHHIRAEVDYSYGQSGNAGHEYLSVKPLIRVLFNRLSSSDACCAGRIGILQRFGEYSEIGRLGSASIPI